jgi:hypothetical protein
MGTMARASTFCICVVNLDLTDYSLQLLINLHPQLSLTS